MWKAESIFYPPTIRDTASASSEAVSVPKETEVAQSEATQLTVIPGESTEGGKPHEVTETPGGPNPEMPQ